jgi:hypothetical protein
MGHHPHGKSPQIGHLWPHHRSMVRAAFEGARPKDLAQAYGMTESQISCVINSPIFQAELSRLEAEAELSLTEARRNLKILADKSVIMISEELEALQEAESFPERKLKIKTCFDVLDRIKVVPDAPQVHLHQHAHAHIENMSDRELLHDVMDLAKEENQ